MKKLFKNYFMVSIGTGLCRGLSFITTLILARAMGAFSFGIFSLFFTVAMLAWQLPTIIDAIYVRYAKTRTDPDSRDIPIPEKDDTLIKATFLMKIIFSLSLMILSYPLGYLLARYIFNKPEMVHYMFTAIMSGAFLSIFSTLSAIFQARERFYLYSLINLIFYGIVFLAVAAIALLRLKLTPLSAAAAYSIPAVIIGLAGIVYLYKLAGPISGIRAPLLRNMFHFGKWLFGVSIIELILQRADILFLARLIGYEELGIYSAAVRVAMLATVLTSSATVIFMPRGCASLNSKAQLASYFKESFTLSSVLSVGILALIALSGPIIKIFFGPQYLASLTAARILLLDCIFILLYTPFSFLYYANGDTRRIFGLSLAKLAIMSVCLMLLVPRLGITGAAVSAAVSSLLTFLLIAVLSQKIIKSPAPAVSTYAA